MGISKYEDVPQSEYRVQNVLQKKSIKQNMYNVIQALDLDENVLPLLATMAGLPLGIVENMLLNIAIKREHAEKILKALSEYCTDKEYSLDTVQVALLEEGTE